MSRDCPINWKLIRKNGNPEAGLAKNGEFKKFTPETEAEGATPPVNLGGPMPIQLEPPAFR
jgi:hypothetical protein